MRNVELFTKEGKTVKVLSIPPFQTPPEVVIWGIRVFVLEDENPRGDGVPVYREVFAYAAPANA